MLTSTQIASLKTKAQRYGHTSVKDFKAKGDGKAIDLGYLYEAVDFIQNHIDGQGVLFFPNGVYRCNKTWQIGGQAITAADALRYPGERKQSRGGAPSFNMAEHLKGGSTLPVSLKFAARAYIWGDFTPDEITPVVSYGCSAYHYGGNATQSTRIDGLKIMGKTQLDYNVVGRDSKQIGLLMTGGNSITLADCSFYGLQEGFVENGSYYNTKIQMVFGNCGRGYYNLYSNAGTGINFKADHCDLGYEIFSSAGNYTSIFSEQCLRGLIAGHGVNVFTTGYFEQMDNTSAENDYQIQVGYPEGHPFHNDTFIGVEFNCYAVSAKNQKHFLIEQGTASNEGVPNVTIKNSMVFGYNHYKSDRTIIESKGINWQKI